MSTATHADPTIEAHREHERQPPPVVPKLSRLTSTVEPVERVKWSAKRSPHVVRTWWSLNGVGFALVAGAVALALGSWVGLVVGVAVGVAVVYLVAFGYCLCRADLEMPKPTALPEVIILGDDDDDRWWHEVR